MMVLVMCDEFRVVDSTTTTMMMSDGLIVT
jgi:hypothetical protein